MLENIKLLILDNDGVLTDGKIYYDNHRIETKGFSAKDGLGIKLLKFTDIQIAIITGRTSEILAQRCEDLKIEFLFQKVQNKLQVAEKLLNKLGLTWQNVAYMGDDWNDFPVMEKAAFTAVPNNVFPNFQKVADFVSKYPGGQGAVREFIEYILNSRGEYEQVLQKFLAHLHSS